MSRFEEFDGQLRSPARKPKTPMTTGTLPIAQTRNEPTIANLLPGFVEYMSVERQFSPATITKYREGIQCFLRLVGDRRVPEVTLQDFISLKARMVERNVRESRIIGLIAALKTFLIYVRDIHGISVLDLKTVTFPKRPKREIVYLSNEELHRFIEAIPLRTWEGKLRLSGYRLRALVEVLATTGMRISEALSLNRNDINFELAEAKVIGKGNKVRTVFFSQRALDWLRRYLDLRADTDHALFATKGGGTLSSASVNSMFRRITRWAGLEKNVTPHIIRHTTATNLLRNGCPIGFIKEVLGHEKLQTTCQFYLGVLDHAGTKKAHATYQNFDVQDTRTQTEAEVPSASRSSQDRPLTKPAWELR